MSQKINKKILKNVGQGLVLIVFLFGIVSYLNFNKAISLNVDGKVTNFYSSGKAVADVLEAANVNFSYEDQVSPSLDTEIFSGQTIEVNSKKDVLLNIDGMVQNISTNSNTVADLLEEHNIEEENSVVHLQNVANSLPTTGAEITVLQEKKVTIFSKDKEFTVTTLANTVGEVLDKAGFPVEAQQYSSSAPHNALVVSGMSLRVFELERVANETVVEKIAFSTEIVENEEMFEGQTEIKQEGSVGSRVVSLTDVIIDGQHVGVSVDLDEVVEQPVNKIVAKGIKAKPAVSSQDFSDFKTNDNLNWAALAKCESGGNPNINTGNGYYGAYQFNLGTWIGNGGTGYPHENSLEEQTRIAQNLYASRGASPWPHCGKLL